MADMKKIQKKWSCLTSNLYHLWLKNQNKSLINYQISWTIRRQPKKRSQMFPRIFGYKNIFYYQQILTIGSKHPGTTQRIASKGKNIMLPIRSIHLAQSESVHFPIQSNSLAKRMKPRNRPLSKQIEKQKNRKIKAKMSAKTIPNRTLKAKQSRKDRPVRWGIFASQMCVCVQLSEQ